MKKITITLHPAVAAWTRQHAADRRITVSQVVAEVLQQKMKEVAGYEAAMRSFLSRKPVPFDDSPYPKREELHDRG